MKSAVTVSLVPEARGGPFVFWDGLENAWTQAAAMGFDAVEIFPGSADDVDVPRVQALRARHGVGVAAVGTGAGWVRHKLRLTDADPAVRRRAIDFVAAIIDRAGALGAPAIIGSMQGRWEGAVSREQALAWLAEALEELGERAGRHGVSLLYEFLNRYETNLLNRAEETAAFVGGLRTRHVRVLCDLFHMNIEETDLAAALRAAGPRVGHVHFADSNRRAAGCGHTDFRPIVAALREIGYAGYLSAEVFAWPDAAAAAAQTMRAFQAVKAA